MRFLVDRCTGRCLADWLRTEGHDVVETQERGPDPGDAAVLRWAASEGRVLITIDTDFGALIFQQVRHILGSSGYPMCLRASGSTSRATCSLATQPI